MMPPLLALLLLLPLCSPLSLPASAPRRAFLRSAPAALVPLVAFSAPPPSLASLPTDETTLVTSRLGGLLEKYQDSRGGWRLMSPTNWNKFEGNADLGYDVKWQDLIAPIETVKVTSAATALKSIDELGEAEAVGGKLAAKRSAKVQSVAVRSTDGIVFYTFDLTVGEGKEAVHQLLSLSVNKGKIWFCEAMSGDKNWGKRKEMYENILGSFMPKLT
ncbi:hypothetical protein TeGR_g4345 [Tetraparma gracilis]|uniref:PsbP C-terminal domain-containing protein n=1 Tax=Tetraparma gracilis TaxID=2962635 RepID=A0ABQ6M3T1_9STRA|nr:hypothetical protein TeGR_g4345 [Tetraparma gracilis]